MDSIASSESTIGTFESPVATRFDPVRLGLAGAIVAAAAMLVIDTASMLDRYERGVEMVREWHGVFRADTRRNDPQHG